MSAKKPRPPAVAGPPAPVMGTAAPKVEETAPTAQSTSGHPGTPKPSTVPAPQSPMDVHQGTAMPKPASPMDVHQGTAMPKPASPMDVHQGPAMPKPASPMDVHQEPEPAFSRSGAGFDPAATAEAANATFDLLSVILGPYIFPNAEEDYEKRIKELQDELQPTIEAQVSELLKNETPRIAELGVAVTSYLLLSRWLSGLNSRMLQGSRQYLAVCNLTTCSSVQRTLTKWSLLIQFGTSPGAMRSAPAESTRYIRSQCRRLFKNKLYGNFGTPGRLISRNSTVSRIP